MFSCRRDLSPYRSVRFLTGDWVPQGRLCRVSPVPPPPSGSGISKDIIVIGISTVMFAAPLYMKSIVGFGIVIVGVPGGPSPFSPPPPGNLLFGDPGKNPFHGFGAEGSLLQLGVVSRCCHVENPLLLIKWGHFLAAGGFYPL